MASAKTTGRLPRAESRAKIVAAAMELVREHSYPELSVGQVMQRAGIERTLFYRHFEDLGDLLIDAGRELTESLYDAQIDLGESPRRKRDAPRRRSSRRSSGWSTSTNATAPSCACCPRRPRATRRWPRARGRSATASTS